MRPRGLSWSRNRGERWIPVAEVAVEQGAAGGEGAAGEQGGAQAPGLDLSPLTQRFDGLDGRMSRIEEIAQQFAQQGHEGQQGQESAGGELDALFDDQSGEMTPAQAQALLQQAMQPHLQSQVAPLLDRLQTAEQRLSEVQMGLDAEALTARYPALADIKVAGPVVDQARQLADAMGQPALATSIPFIEVVYKAQMADKYAAGEVPAGVEKQFGLESGAGANPQNGTPEPNIAERIIAQRQGAQQPWTKW